MERFKENDIIDTNMIGTERQVFARIYVQCQQFDELKDKVAEFKKTLEIKDIHGENMIIDWVSPDSIINYKSN